VDSLTRRETSKFNQPLPRHIKGDKYMEEKNRVRVRINISTSVKGVKTYDATIELVDEFVNQEDVKRLKGICLQEEDSLIAELDKRYPAGGGLE